MMHDEYMHFSHFSLKNWVDLPLKTSLFNIKIKKLHNPHILKINLCKLQYIIIKNKIVIRISLGIVFLAQRGIANI